MADEEFKQYFFAESWLELSLDDGMKCFLKWRDQYEGWCSRYGQCGQFIGLEAKYHAFYLLDSQLLDVLRDRMEEENFRDMDRETFVQELLDIFGEASQDDEEFDEEEEEDDVVCEDPDEEFDEEEENDAVRKDLDEEFDEEEENDAVREDR